MDKHIVASSGSSTPERTFFTTADGRAMEMIDNSENHGDFDAIAQAFFEIDGYTSRILMPFPHDPFREPVPWKKYDHLSVKDRIDQLRAKGSFSDSDLDVFEGTSNGSGLTHAGKRGFTEFLFFWALGGHSMAGITEANGVWKLGNGGMTEWSKRTLHDYRGDLALGCEVTSIEQKNFRGCGATHERWNCLSGIDFKPPLSTLRRQAIDQGHVNLGSKIHVELANIGEAWAAFCSPRSGSKLTSAFSDHHMDRQSYGVAFGYAEADLDIMDSSTVRKEMSALFPPEEELAVTSYISHDWTKDPFAKGSWAAYPPSYMSRYQQELQKDHGEIIFASGDWADGWRGSIDGAIASGALSARRLIEKHEAQKSSSNGTA